MKGNVHEDFVVLKGIEYDTCDGGHIICIMPEGVKMRILEIKGLPVATLIDIVHRHGGILGPAHPCGEKYLSFTNTKKYFKSPELIKRFDFVEAFNACETEESNAAAAKLATKYHKVGIGGSDAHRPDSIGLGYTILPEYVTCETELINLLRKKPHTITEGKIYGKTTRDRMGKMNDLYAYSFWLYNKGGELLKRHKRKVKGDEENPMSPIDPIEIPYLNSLKAK